MIELNWFTVDKKTNPEAAPNPHPEPHLDTNLRNRARRDVILYGLARLGLFIILTIIIQAIAMAASAPIPLIMSSLLALLVAFPLSMLIFRGLRNRVTEEVAAWDTNRKAHKQWIHSELEGR